MFRIGEKVRYGSKRGIVTYVGFDGSWYNIRTNKGKDYKLIPFNCLISREVKSTQYVGLISC